MLELIGKFLYKLFHNTLLQCACQIFMKVRTNDLIQIEIPEIITKESELLSDLLLVNNGNNEAIPLHHVDSKTINLVIKMCSELHSLSNLDDKSLVNLSNAVVFMSMPKLQDVCVKEFRSRVEAYYAKSDHHALKRLLPMHEMN